MKKIAIIQSNYIPWKGYFDMINMVDEFILYDDAQYTKNDWRNRNKIKTIIGIEWITIPVKQEKLQQKIKDTKISFKDWKKKHIKTIFTNYSKSKYFKEYKDFFEDLYYKCNEDFLSEINFKFISEINKLLDIKTNIRFSNEFILEGNKTEKLICICKQSKANIYLSGPSAKGYLDEALMNKEGIYVEWMDYNGYPEYNQLYPPFEHAVSIIDLILNEGPKAKNYMKSFNL